MCCWRILVDLFRHLHRNQHDRSDSIVPECLRQCEWHRQNVRLICQDLVMCLSSSKKISSDRVQWFDRFFRHLASESLPRDRQCVRQHYSQWSASYLVARHVDVEKYIWPIAKCRVRRILVPIPFDSDMAHARLDCNRRWWCCNRHAWNKHHECLDLASSFGRPQSHVLQSSSDALDWSACNKMLLDRERLVFLASSAFVECTNKIQFSDVDIEMVSRSTISFWIDSVRSSSLGLQVKKQWKNCEWISRVIYVSLEL